MKKIITILLLLTLLFTTHAYAKPGDIAGYIYSTDIVAYIDDMAVPSYNIGGKTVVIAEELDAYGFDVIWNEDDREICVYTKEMPENKPSYIPEKSKISGKVAGKIYETDIKAYTNGMITESYNVGGRTALVIEDMASTDDDAKRMSRDSNPHRSIGYSVSLMKFVWNETDRTILLFTVRPGSKLMTDYGEVTVKNASQSAYHNGAYSFYTVDDERLAYWVSTILYNDDAYISLADIKDNLIFGDLSAGIDGNELKISAENIREVLHTNASTIGRCQNMLITLSGKLSINGNASQTENEDMILYRGDIFICESAINSAIGAKKISYKYELPEGCTDHIDDSRLSHVVVYINDNHINSFNTLDGNCYVSVKDLKEHGFNVETDGNAFKISTPEKAVDLQQETEYPATRWHGDVDETSVLFPIYNGVYDVTVDGKEIDDVFVHTSLVFRSPCISVQNLAKIAGYIIDTSDPFKVKIYTEN